MAGLKTASGEDIDSSFELQVEVEEGDAVGQDGPTGPTEATRTLALRVTGDLHVGGLMLLIAETVGARRDWSDHALWWAQRHQWLLRPGRTLDALGVGGDARLRFAPQHRPLRLRLPTGRSLRLRLHFARPAAHAVGQACRLLGVRYSEELSLLRPEEEERGGGWGQSKKRRGPPPAPDFDLCHLRPPPGDEGPWPEPLPPGCLQTLLTASGGSGAPAPSRGNPLLRRARLHARWLDPGRSLLEQDVADDEELLLRFKFLSLLDLDPQRDGPRLRLLLAQGRWALLNEELECTEEEALQLAALQYLAEEPGGSGEPGTGGGPDLDDLDTALSRLEVTLEGGTAAPGPLEQLTAEPQLDEELEFYRPRKLTLRGFRPARALLKDSMLSLGTSGDPPTQLNLRGCEVTPAADVAGQKFCIKLLVAAPDGMSELELRCRDVRAAPQFARWVAGCRLASRGRSLGDIGAEARGVLGVLGLPPAGGAPAPTPGAPGAAARPPPDPSALLPPRFLRKGKAKQLAPRLLEVLHRLGALPPAQARLRFLEAWRALPGFGTAYFVVRVKGSRRDEVVAVGPARLLRLEPDSGRVTRSWRYSELRQWGVNWDSQQVTLELSGELTLALRVLSAPCRVLHEFLGGYLCLGGARPGQPPDPRLLEQLRGGGEEP